MSYYFVSSLYILEISSLSDVEFVKPFSYLIGCLFVLLTIPLLYRSFSVSGGPIYLWDTLSVCATGAIFRKWSPVPMDWRVLPTFSSIRFSVVGFILWSLIHLDLSFVHRVRIWIYFYFLHVAIQLDQHHCWRCFLFFHCIILAFFLSKIRCS